MVASSARILYYAFGGGLGHATRTLSLMRHLARQLPGLHRLLVNTRFADVVREEVGRIPGAELSVAPPTQNADAARAFVYEQFRDIDPTGLVVDTFPRGLGGDLVDVLEQFASGKRVLISRGLPAAYVDEFRLREFVDRHYQIAIAPGEPSPFASTNRIFHQTAPFLIRDDSDLNSGKPADARILIVGSGTHAECRDLVSQTRQLHELESIRSVALALPTNVEDLNPGPVDIIRHYPLMERLPEFRGVIGAAGYNLASEVAALKMTAILFPRHRLYDDQRQRANRSAWPSPSEMARFVQRTSIAPPETTRHFENGAVKAAEHIATLFA